MSNRIPNFGWNRLKLATLTYEQLAQLEEGRACLQKRHSPLRQGRSAQTRCP